MFASRPYFRLGLSYRFLWPWKFLKLQVQGCSFLLVAMRSLWLFALLALMDSVVRAEETTEGDESAEGIEESAEADLDADQDAAPHETLADDDPLAMHGKLDKNEDFEVTMAELLTSAREMVAAMRTSKAIAFFGEMDTSRDGLLSLDEYLEDVHTQHADFQNQADLDVTKAVETKKFFAADVNSDKVIDLDELEHLIFPGEVAPVLHIHTLETMRQVDSDGDGKLSREEFLVPEAQTREGDFEALDANKDGSLDLEEMKVWDSGTYHVEESMRQMFKLADADGDSQISASEFEDSWPEISTTDGGEFIAKWAMKAGLTRDEL